MKAVPSKSKSKAAEAPARSAKPRSERADKHLMEAVGAQVKSLRQSLNITASEVAQACT